MDEHLASCLQSFEPTAFHGAICAAIEAGILGEMIEAVTGAVEASSNEMAAIIIGPAIGLSGAGLGRDRGAAGPIDNWP